MVDSRLLASVKPWIERRLGVPLSEAGRDKVTVVPVEPQRADAPSLWAVRLGDRAIVTARPEWVERLRQIVDSLHPDLLFSTFGAYELSRVTLPDGVRVSGPAWFLFGDTTTYRPVDAPHIVERRPSELHDVDREAFWHCPIDEVLSGFAIYEGERLVALATVTDVGDPVWEIGMEVEPRAKGRGLGRAVVSAAAGWILAHRRIVLATVGSFNVPSARTLRSVGLRYLFAAMDGQEGPFEVPPQPLGSPYPGAEVHNFYPEWAMNQDIRPRPDS